MIFNEKLSRLTLLMSLFTAAFIPHSVIAASGCTDTAPAINVSGATVAVCTQTGLQSAINSSVNGRVSLPATCAITLTSAIQINKDIIIEGNSGTISGNNATRIFDVNRDFSMNRGFNFTAQNLTLTNGRDSGSGGGAVRGAQFGTMTFVNVNFINNVSQGIGGEDGGGAIFKDEGGKLTIFASTFQGNMATNGGAIKSLLANVQIVESAFVSNTARGGNNGGGGVFVDGLEINTPRQTLSQNGYVPDNYSFNTYGKARFCGVLFQGNVVNGLHDTNVTGRQGGALFTHTYAIGGAPISGTSFFTSRGYSAVEIERTVFDSNAAFDGGGALRLGGDGGNTTATALIKDSMFTGNRGGNHGGAVRMSYGNDTGANTFVAANFSNLTLADNCANVDGNIANCTSASGSGGIGGGIVAFEKQYNIDRSTLARNRSASYGGATSQDTLRSMPGSMRDSIVSANLSGNQFNVDKNCTGPVFTSGVNSYEWPQASMAGGFDRGCGAATVANPNVSSIKTSCTTSAGSTSNSISHYFFLPNAAVPQTAGVPNAGAICPTASVVVPSVPGVPIIETTVAGDSQATVGFSAPSSAGSSQITSYVATSSPGNVTGSCAAPCTSILVIGLINATSYSFSVTAINSVGSSAASAQSNTVTPSASAALQAQTITFNPVAVRLSNSAPFMITASGGASGNPVVFSTLSPSICNVSGINGSTISLTGVVGSCTIRAAQAGNASYTVAANVDRTITVNNPVVAPPPPPPPPLPTAPTDLICVSQSGGTIRCSFGASANVNGVPSPYQLACRNDAGAMMFNQATALTSITISSLPLGRAYTCQVTATGSIGNSAASNSARVAPQMTPISLRQMIDVDGAGLANIYVRNAGSGVQGEALVGRFDGQRFNFLPITDISAGWSLLGMGDFNGAHRSSVLSRNSDSNVRVDFPALSPLNNGINLRNAKPDWVVAAIGDLDGDGKSDILWRYTLPGSNDSGVTFAWFMDGAATGVTTSVNVDEVKHRGGAPLSWNLIGITDLSGDGLGDIVWVSPTNELRALMGAARRMWLNQRVGAVPAGYSVIMLGDVNGDGKGDIVFKDGQGRLKAWLMTGTQISSDIDLPIINPAWTLYASGDFDGNGTVDLVWLRQDGNLVLWLMTPGNPAQPTVIDNVGRGPIGYVIIRP